MIDIKVVYDNHSLVYCLASRREVGLGSSQVAKHRPTFYEGKLGQYFRDLREERGWTLSRAVQIAGQRKLPVGLSSLKWLEGGLTKRPEPELLRALSKLYNEPYGVIVQEVSRHMYAIESHEFLEGATPPTSIEGFVALPILSTPISARHPLLVVPDATQTNHLAFRREFVARFTRPVVLRVGRKTAAMQPTIEPNDVVVINQNLIRRRRPPAGRIFAVNEGPLTGKEGGSLARVELSKRTLILSTDHSDKTRYPTRTFEVTASTLPEVLVGEVVWVGRSLTRGRSPSS